MNKLIFACLTALLTSCCLVGQEKETTDAGITGNEPVGTESVTYGQRLPCSPSQDTATPPVVSAGLPGYQGSTSLVGTRPERRADPEVHSDAVTHHEGDRAIRRYGMVAGPETAQAWRAEKLSVLEQVIEDEAEKEFKIFELVNSNLTTEQEAVGAVYEGVSLESATSICTATLISCNLAITARHCVPNRASGNVQYWVYFQHSGMFEVKETEIEVYCDSPNCESETDKFNDIAILPLAEPINDVQPIELGNNCDWDPGTRAEIVGFGVSSLSLEDYNLKRNAEVTLSECQNQPIDERSICYELAPGRPGACNHDSGGPLLTVSDGGAAKLIGVLIKSGPTCVSYQARYNNTTSSVYAPWIAERINRSQDQCSAIDTPFNELIDWPGRRLPQETLGVEEHMHDMEVSAGSDLLLVNLNYPPGIVGPGNRFDLHLDKVSDDGTGTVDYSLAPSCFNKGDQVSICRVDSPTPGAWRAKVSWVQGEDYYQLVATEHTW